MRSYTISLAGTTTTNLTDALDGDGTAMDRDIVGHKSIITVQADPDNAGTVSVGDSGIATASLLGLLLEAGDSYTMVGAKPQDVWVKASAGTQILGINVNSAK